MVINHESTGSRMKESLGALNLAKFVCWDKYAKFIPDQNRKETWDETIGRGVEGLVEQYGHLGSSFEEEIRHNFSYVKNRQVFCSMRYLQFAGPAVQANNARVFNCAYQPLDAIEAFSENMFLLLSGCGIGYSVQKHHLDKLPDLRRPAHSQRWVVEDTIEGWADAKGQAVGAYLGYYDLPVFDYSEIREKNSLLVTTGGLAPGAGPLIKALDNILNLLRRAVDDGHTRLTSLMAHDIECFGADAVMAGGIRRAAMISLFDADDQEMLSCKSPGNFDPMNDINAQRARANNSAMLYLFEDEAVLKARFDGLMRVCQESGVGEPGVVFSNDISKQDGYNPCVEASLRPHSFCNLTTMVVTHINNQEEFNKLARVAAFLGTLQAGFTKNLDHYLRPIWKETTEEDALIGVSMTGMACGNVDGLDMAQAAKEVLAENERVAKILGINLAARTSLLKPEGTSTLAAGLGDTPGCHRGTARFLLRRCGVEKNSPIAIHYRSYHPDSYEDSVYDDADAFLVFPIENPESIKLQEEESAVEFLDYVIRVSQEWIKPGMRRGNNSHNASATCRVKPDEWDDVIEKVWTNRYSVSGLSFFPAANLSSFPQLIYERITEEEYLKRTREVTEIFPETIWLDHGVNFAQEPACQGNNCEM
jgi:ribonucleoside-triphosphate reductase